MGESPKFFLERTKPHSRLKKHLNRLPATLCFTALAAFVGTDSSQASQCITNSLRLEAFCGGGWVTEEEEEEEVSAASSEF